MSAAARSVSAGAATHTERQKHPEPLRVPWRARMRAERLLIRLAAPLMFGGAWRGDGCNAGQCSHNSHCCGGWCGDCDNCIDCAAGHYCPSTWAASEG